jgi:hypothetical protein
MDPIVAKRMEGELVGKLVGSWKPDRLLGNGKSAVVFHATRDGQEAALKVFDPDLVQRLGEGTQLQRIEREKRLIGKKHENLVEIYDGGSAVRRVTCTWRCSASTRPTLRRCSRKCPGTESGP